MFRPARHDLAAKSRALRDQGWCVLEEVLSASERAHARARLTRYLDDPEGQQLEGYGLKIFALFARLPDLAAPLARGDVRALSEQVLGDRASVRQSVARLSARVSMERVPWHHHHAWPADLLARRARCERLGILCYPEGTSDGNGPLLVVPRAFSAPLAAFEPRDVAPRSDAIEVAVPPGSVVLLDAAAVHSALRPTTDALRILYGAQVQPAGLRRAHAEDDPPLTLWRLRARRWLGRD